MMVKTIMFLLNNNNVIVFRDDIELKSQTWTLDLPPTNYVMILRKLLINLSKSFKFQENGIKIS